VKLLLLTGFYAATFAAFPRPTLEYEVKAAFLLNFVTFTEWPATAFESPSSPLRICIVGDDPFDGSLARTVQGETVAGHPLTVSRLEPGESSASCHALFVPNAVSQRGSAIDRENPQAPVLLVSESDVLWHAGAIINFAVDGGRVRFDVNRTAAGRHGLRLSPKLLQIARVVK
jgi:hypothetical protein